MCCVAYAGQLLAINQIDLTVETANRCVLVSLSSSAVRHLASVETHVEHRTPEVIMQRPTKFEIKGLFGDRDVTLSMEGDALILVGPNGIGKSSVINIFYFFVSRQWSRLAEYHFSEVALWFGDEEVRAARADITGLSQFDKLVRTFPASSRISTYIEKLRADGLLEEFISSGKLTARSRE
jgi:hypothetical protein